MFKLVAVTKGQAESVVIASNGEGLVVLHVAEGTSPNSKNKLPCAVYDECLAMSLRILWQAEEYTCLLALPIA